MIVAVWRKELASLWLTPVPYVVAALFHVAVGVLFIDSLQARTQAVWQPIVPLAGFLLLAMAPPLTMRTVADETRSGTLDVLLAIPMRAAPLVIGKWLACLTTMVAIALPLGLHVALLQWWGDPDVGPVLSGTLGLVLFAALVCAVGVLASSLTSSLAVAALGSFFVLLLSWFLQPSTSQLALRTLTARLSLSERLRAFAAGGVDTGDLGFFVLVTAACLVAAALAVDGRRAR